MGAFRSKRASAGPCNGVQMNDVWEETPNICEQHGLEPVKNQGCQHPRLETHISSSTTQASQVFSSLLGFKGKKFLLICS